MSSWSRLAMITSFSDSIWHLVGFTAWNEMKKKQQPSKAGDDFLYMVFLVGKLF